MFDVWWPKWLEQVSQWHEVYCPDLEVMSSKPSRIKLGVRSTSVQSHTWIKNIIVVGGEWGKMHTPSNHSLLTTYYIVSHKFNTLRWSTCSWQHFMGSTCSLVIGKPGGMRGDVDIYDIIFLYNRISFILCLLLPYRKTNMGSIGVVALHSGDQGSNPAHSTNSKL